MLLAEEERTIDREHSPGCKAFQGREEMGKKKKKTIRSKKLGSETERSLRNLDKLERYLRNDLLLNPDKRRRCLKIWKVYEQEKIPFPLQQRKKTRFILRQGQGPSAKDTTPDQKKHRKDSYIETCRDETKK